MLLWQVLQSLLWVKCISSILMTVPYLYDPFLPCIAFSFHLSLTIFLMSTLYLFLSCLAFLVAVLLVSVVRSCSASLKYLAASFGTEWSALELWCLRTAWIWGSFLLSLTIVALYSISRFLRDLPPSRHGRYILCRSAFLASILFIQSSFLVTLSRSCVPSSFQSMIP